MDILLRLIFVVGIGALIGGYTNFIAIKMLFRPHHEMRIGKWKLPFTPGLIPKRRGELAEQMGVLVTEHLLTPETVQRKLGDERFQLQVSEWLSEKIKEIVRSEKTVREILNSRGFQRGEEVFNGFTRELLEKTFRQLIEENRTNRIGEVIPVSLWAALENHIPTLAKYLKDSLKEYLEGSGGREMLEVQLEGYLNSKGRFGGFINTLLGTRAMADKIQSELLTIIDLPDSERMIENLFLNQLQRFKNLTLDEAISKLGLSDKGKNIHETIRANLPTEIIFDKPIKSFTSTDWDEKIETSLAPKIVSFISQLVIVHLPSIMDRLGIATLVKDQVNSFPTERLEELIVSIAKKELKMITFLGAFLGGLIGFIQGIILLLFP